MTIRRIAVTGGPGAGKTTIWRELARRRADRVVLVPEVATLMLQHVFPHVEHDEERRAIQRSIYRVQCDTEAVYERRLGPTQCLLADRGTPDGGAYWPEGHDAFFRAMNTDLQTELRRYDAVLFLETAAAGGYAIDAGNPTRIEDLDTAIAIDRRLHELWSAHPRFEPIAHHPDFSVKVERGCAALARLLGADGE